MKDSGIEWIGEIPDDWKVGKIKWMSDIYTGNSIPTEIKDTYNDSVDAVPYIATKDISLRSNHIDYENGIFIKNQDNSFKRAPANSTLLCIEGGSAGRKISFTNQEVAFVNKLCCFKPDGENSKYIYYYLQSPAFKSEFDLNISGLIGGVSIGLLKNHSITIPPNKEQQKIANFLDQKVSEIDHILEKTRESIEEYKKYKQSIITEVVTKGLNPYVEMKDSGIEWIGEIPEHWKMIRMKNTSWLKGRIGWQGLKSSEYIEEGPFLITGTDFTYGKINWDTCVHITEERFEEAPEIHIIEDDLLITKDGTVGKVAIVKNCPQKVSLNSGVMIIRNTNKIKYDSKFLYYILLSDEFWTWFNSNISGNSTIIHLYQEQFYNFRYVLPPIDEQIQIIEFLDEKVKTIDSLISQKETLLKDLELYKKSLIYECVTGKREVM